MSRLSDDTRKRYANLEVRIDGEWREKKDETYTDVMTVDVNNPEATHFRVVVNGWFFLTDLTDRNLAIKAAEFACSCINYGESRKLDEIKKVLGLGALR